MNAKLEHIAERNLAIYNDYLHLWSNGQRFDIINETLGKKYFLNPLTISRTITKMSKVKK